MKNKTSLLLAAMLAAGLSGAANASYVTVSSDGGFSGITGDPTAFITGTTSTVNGTSVNSAVEWADASQAMITSMFNDSVNIDALDTSYLLSSFVYHNDFWGPGLNVELSADVESLLNFSTASAGAIGSDVSQLTLDIFETEDNEDCIGGESESGLGGDEHEHAVWDDVGIGCDDYIDITSNGAFDIPLFIDGQNFVFSTYFSYDSAGQDPIAGHRFWSLEEEIDTLYRFGSLSMAPVSVDEPTTMALFGLALFGGALSRRRSKAKS